MKKQLLNALLAVTMIASGTTTLLAGESGHHDGASDGANSAAVQPDGSQDIRRSIQLMSTPVGSRFHAGGSASYRVRGSRQNFKVDVDMHVPDGTVLRIQVDGSVVGSVRVHLGEAEFEVENDDGMPLPEGLDPVTSIKEVSVLSNNGTALLQGSF